MSEDLIWKNRDGVFKTFYFSQEKKRLKQFYQGYGKADAELVESRAEGKTDVFATIQPLKDLPGQYFKNTADNVIAYDYCFVDIDCAKKGIAPDFVVSMIDDACSDFLAPTFIHYSGTGLWLFWEIEREYRNPDIDYEWDRVQEYIYNLFIDYNPDWSVVHPKQRICRIAGSISGKSGKTVYDEEYSGNIYTLEDLHELVPDNFSIHLSLFQSESETLEDLDIDEVDSYPVPYIYNRLLRQRYLVAVQHLLVFRNSGGGSGRENHLFMIFNILVNAGYDEKDALSTTVQINSLLDYPFDKSELIRRLRATYKTILAHKSAYKYTREGFILKLDIKKDEAKALDFPYDDEDRRQRINANARRRYRSKVGRSCKDKAVEQNKAIEKYVQDGLSVKEACEKVGVKPRTYRKRKRLEKDRLLFSCNKLSNKTILINDHHKQASLETLPTKEKSKPLSTTSSVINNASKETSESTGTTVSLASAFTKLQELANGFSNVSFKPYVDVFVDNVTNYVPLNKKGFEHNLATGLIWLTTKYLKEPVPELIVFDLNLVFMDLQVQRCHIYYHGKQIFKKDFTGEVPYVDELKPNVVKKEPNPPTRGYHDLTHDEIDMLKLADRLATLEEKFEKINASEVFKTFETAIEKPTANGRNAFLFINQLSKTNLRYVKKVVAAFNKYKDSPDFANQICLDVFSCNVSDLKIEIKPPSPAQRASRKLYAQNQEKAEFVKISDDPSAIAFKRLRSNTYNCENYSVEYDGLSYDADAIRKVLYRVTKKDLTQAEEFCSDEALLDFWIQTVEQRESKRFGKEPTVLSEELESL